jgi:hypothetical protein
MLGSTAARLPQFWRLGECGHGRAHGVECRIPFTIISRTVQDGPQEWPGTRQMIAGQFAFSRQEWYNVTC